MAMAEDSPRARGQARQQSHWGRPGSWVSVGCVFAGCVVIGVALAAWPAAAALAVGLLLIVAGAVFGIVFDVFSDVIVDDPHDEPEESHTTPLRALRRDG